jgi:glycerophosphoryl diester phosphodiesterase
MSAPDWLTACPIAHRGLHDAARGVIENSLSAVDAAIARGYAIECDIQLSSDGEAIVFHDDTLERLTDAAGPVAQRRAVELTACALKGSSDRIPTLETFLARIGGRVPLICEIKSRFDGNLKLAERACAVVSQYAGPVAFKSFDPAVIAALRESADSRPRGIVGESHHDHAAWNSLTARQKFSMANLLHYEETLPDFLSWRVSDLVSAVPYLCRAGIGMPVMTWTVRSDADRTLARDHADQIVFEGFTP